MPGWRVAPAVLMDSPVPKPNIETEAKSGEGACVPPSPIARKALENAGKASLQVRSRKGTILAASRLKRDANAEREEAARESKKGSEIDAGQKENLAPTAAGDLSSSNRLMMLEARLPPAMRLPEETPLPKTPVRQLETSSAAVTVNDDLDNSLFEAMDTFSIKTPTASSLGVPPRKRTSASKIPTSNPTNSTATSSLFSSVASTLDMSLCSPLPDLVLEDEELLWLEEPRASSNGDTRAELVSNLAGLLKRNVSASPLVKNTNLTTAPPDGGQSLQNTPEKAAISEMKMPINSKISQSSPNIPRNELKRGESQQAIGSSGRKRVVKSVTATPSPLAQESTLPRTMQAQHLSSEGTRISSPLASANGAASSEGRRVIGAPLASAVLAPKSIEGKRTNCSPLASAVLTPRRGKAASVRPHQGVPFNVKPTPSPIKASGGRMVREPLSSQSPISTTTPRRRKLLPLKPLNMLDVTVDPASTATLDSPLKPVQFTEVHRVVKKPLPLHSNSSSSLNSGPSSHMAPPKTGLLGKSSSSSRLPLPVSIVSKNL